MSDDRKTQPGELVDTMSGINYLCNTCDVYGVALFGEPLICWCCQGTNVESPKWDDPGSSAYSPSYPE